jgi:hypothetical protein
MGPDIFRATFQKILLVIMYTRDGIRSQNNRQLRCE